MISRKNDIKSGLSHEMSRVCQDVICDLNWRLMLGETTRILAEFDAGIAEEIDFERHESISLQRMVRYCLPIFEIHQAIDGFQLNPNLLASIFLWQECWRPLDNLLDSDGKVTTNLREYNYQLLRAWSFHQKTYPESRLMERFLTCLNSTIEVEDDLDARTDPSRIYQRVSLYEVPFDDICGLSKNTIECYRTYINAIGIAHDFGDILKDTALGRITFATAALRKIDEHCCLNASQFAALREEGISTFKVFDDKLDKLDMKQCWVTGRNLKVFYNWAFIV